MVKFSRNFLISFLGYIIINFIGYLTCAALYPEKGIWKYLNTHILPSWLIISIFISSIIFNILVSITLYFLIGRKLNLLGNQLLNYLSVCSSFIFGVIFIYIQLALSINNQQLLYNLNASFGMIWGLVIRLFKENFISYYLMAALPSLFTWIGMIYQSKKILNSTFSKS